jgi:hypothetical protein
MAMRDNNSRNYQWSKLAYHVRGREWHGVTTCVENICIYLFADLLQVWQRAPSHLHMRTRGHNFGPTHENETEASQDSEASGNEDNKQTMTLPLVVTLHKD